MNGFVGSGAGIYWLQIMIVRSTGAGSPRGNTALGADRTRIVWTVLQDVLVVTLAGVGVGVAAVLATSRLLGTFLFHIAPNDPLTLSVASGVLVIAAFMAGYGPARRAARVDPWTSLHD